MVDVSQLVSQMHETLSNIHSTISSLSVLDHEQQLDDIEQKRAAAVAALQSGFSLEADELARKRQAQRDALAEQRRREDEEREARRRQEDEALQAQLADEDRQRHDKLDADTRDVEESTDAMMGTVEEEAKRMLEEGKAKLAALEERRRELNRLIDEQLQMPLPSAPSRRKPRDQALPEMVAASNPVDIFDKHNDNADGDRDALAAPEASPAQVTIMEQESKTGIASTNDATPSSSSTTNMDASAASGTDVPFHENQKYLQDVTTQIVPTVGATTSESPALAEAATSDEISEPEAVVHNQDHRSDVGSMKEFYEPEEVHEGSQKEARLEPTEHNNTTEWQYQEPYVAPETYAYPYAAAQEYVDYGSSYYASAQQSLDPSPVFHEAFGEPILDESMVFSEHGSAAGENIPQSLDQELGNLDGSDTEDEGGQADHASVVFQIAHQEPAPAPEAENAATMHGQDDLFEDDNEGSSGSIGSADNDQDHHDQNEQVHGLEEHVPEAEHLPEVTHKSSPHDIDMPQTPTTIVMVSHDMDEAISGNDITETSLVAGQRPTTPDASTPVATQFKGLANSRHAPQIEEQQQQQQVPVTPPRQTASIYAVTDEDILGEADFLPRDVTHVPWRERGSISSTSIDATPGSVRSQATVSTMSASSSFSSPSPWSAAVVAAAATHNMNSHAGGRSITTNHQDDPFIRNSWSGTPSGHSQGDDAAEHEGDDELILGRDKSLGRQLDYNGPILNAAKGGLALDAVQPPQLPPSSTNSGRPHSIASSSPSSLFQRMRSIFEPPNGGAPGGPGTMTGTLLQSVTATSTPTASLRDPYPATSDSTNRLVEESSTRGMKGGDLDSHGGNGDDDDDQFNEKSSLLQAAPTAGMPSETQDTQETQEVQEAQEVQELTVQTRIVRVVQQVTIDEAESPTKIQQQRQQQQQHSRATSPFRLAWYRAEGWRQQLRASGDIVESCRWTWRVDDQLMARGGDAGSKNRGGRVNLVPQIVATVPSAMRRSLVATTAKKATAARADKPLPPLPKPRWRPPGCLVVW
ncbi:hypothetical protein SCUCBS95973_000833 [Sporothrix curviconia]|uniref:Uncharacterized protein n=1 Tax=Sporothrix curviconia TaxID=1260050 RepID=A0ABP0ATH6_9PEZI